MARRKDRSIEAMLLPGYRDTSEIGGSPFATVYRATEIETGRSVALKVLETDTLPPSLVESFEREIRTVVNVSDHPNIVTLYRLLSTADQRRVLVLELCRESLEHQVRRTGPLPARDVTGIGIKIAGALETAHRHGFLHCDMKPRNLLVTQFGEPALGDFGVAVLHVSGQSSAGGFGSATSHAAPEILEGHRLSPATDVYGLASTLYLLLSGLAPFAAFEGETPASVILRIIRDPVRPLRSETVPLALSDLLQAALAKEPEDRPGTAIEFARALLSLEAASGWPSTAYVVWGQSGSDSSSTHAGRLPAPPAVAISPIVVVTEPPDRLYPSAPSVAVPDVARERPTWPAGGAPAVQSPALVVRPPPMILHRRGPSVSEPAGQGRYVVVPDHLGRGPQHHQPLMAPRPPLLPLGRSPGSSRKGGPSREGVSVESDRPVFVDPLPPTPSEREGSAASGHERAATGAQTMYGRTVPPMLAVRSRTGAGVAPMSRARQLLRSPELLGGLAAAVIVAVAAILLIAGVL